ncbi:MAG: exodeoxyribonuclease VII small subunit [Candidatus Saccharibacteria bacterium]|nr:exodeoxyribonuclease VII small subunit [Candidatus Saccharibacteria bacterium]
MTDKTYQQLREELDEVFAELESEDIDIDEAFKKYERGAELIKQLEAKLKAAENKIKKIEQ